MIEFHVPDFIQQHMDIDRFDHSNVGTLAGAARYAKDFSHPLAGIHLLAGLSRGDMQTHVLLRHNQINDRSISASLEKIYGQREQTIEPTCHDEVINMLRDLSAEPEEYRNPLPRLRDEKARPLDMLYYVLLHSKQTIPVYLASTNIDLDRLLCEIRTARWMEDSALFNPQIHPFKRQPD